MSGLGLGFKCIYSCKSLTCILVNSHISIRIIPKVTCTEISVQIDKSGDC